ncbi:hypothetical protein EDB85DRAFT_2164544 [Lactarius pseudohatsudake]|nr:hypothetical protein EDB85DRAFT_2164544 [Lactarius pseudohatsudake]
MRLDLRVREPMVQDEPLWDAAQSFISSRRLSGRAVELDPPRPLGLYHSSISVKLKLPPIATHSPASTVPSPAHEAERVSIDWTPSRSASPHTQAAPRGKFIEMMNPSKPSNNAEPSSR